MWLLKQILRLYYHVNTNLIPYIPPLSSGVKSTMGKKCVLFAASAHLCPFPSLLNISSSRHTQMPPFLSSSTLQQPSLCQPEDFYLHIADDAWFFAAPTGLFGKRKRVVYSSGVLTGQSKGTNGHVVLTTSSPEAITACKSKTWGREMEDFSLVRCKLETRLL